MEDCPVRSQRPENHEIVLWEFNVSKEQGQHYIQYDSEMCGIEYETKIHVYIIERADN